MIKNLPANAGDVGLIRGSGRSPRVGKGNLLQYSCLENSMDRGSWRAIVHGFTKSGTHITHSREHPGVLSGLCVCSALLPKASVCARVAGRSDLSSKAMSKSLFSLAIIL